LDWSTSNDFLPTWNVIELFNLVSSNFDTH